MARTQTDREQSASLLKQPDFPKQSGSATAGQTRLLPIQAVAFPNGLPGAAEFRRLWTGLTDPGGPGGPACSSPGGCAVAGRCAPETFPAPLIMPLGDSAILLRFGTMLNDVANRAAIALAVALAREPIAGVVEVVPNLISVLLRYDPRLVEPADIEGELRLRLFVLDGAAATGAKWSIPIVFDGPDLDEVAAALGMTTPDFVLAHNAVPLRVLATGFAPGFVYCGLHEEALVVPRRKAVRAAVPAGSVLFAAGQTAIAATEMPTGWHVIGHTEFRNFNAAEESPTRLAAGDMLHFEAAQ